MKNWSTVRDGGKTMKGRKIELYIDEIMYYLINVITILYGENLHGENAVQYFSFML